MEALQLEFKGSNVASHNSSPNIWRGFRIERVELESDEPYDFHSQGDTHYLALHDLVLDDGELIIDGFAPISQNDLRGTVTYTPQGCPLQGWAKPCPRRNAFTAFYFDPMEMREDLGERFTQQSPKPFAYERDASVISTMSKIRDLFITPEIDPLYAESLCIAAALETLGVVRHERHALSRRQIDMLSNYIEAHFENPLTLDELAGVVCLSRSYLSRSFKSSTGIGLHRFVNNLRVEKAKEILAKQPDLPLETVSVMVGFSAPPVFRRAFQLAVGSTPSEYRASMGHLNPNTRQEAVLINALT